MVSSEADRDCDQDNSGLLEDLFDDAYLGRHVDGLPTAEPLTVSEGEDPLEDELETFLGYRGDDPRGSDEAPPTDWVRVALVIGDEAWLQRVRARLTQVSRERRAGRSPSRPADNPDGEEMFAVYASTAGHPFCFGVH